MMARKKKALTIEEHKENGRWLTIARNALIKGMLITDKRTKSDRAPYFKKLMKARDLIDEVRCGLDGEYHSEISDEQFKDNGHVYYGKSHTNRNDDESSL